MKLLSVVATAVTAITGTKVLDEPPEVRNSSAEQPTDPPVRDPYPGATGSGKEPLLIM